MTQLDRMLVYLRLCNSKLDVCMCVAVGDIYEIWASSTLPHGNVVLIGEFVEFCTDSIEERADSCRFLPSIRVFVCFCGPKCSIKACVSWVICMVLGVEWVAGQSLVLK